MPELYYHRSNSDFRGVESFLDAVIVDNSVYEPIYCAGSEGSVTISVLKVDFPNVIQYTQL